MLGHASRSKPWTPAHLRHQGLADDAALLRSGGLRGKILGIAGLLLGDDPSGLIVIRRDHIRRQVRLDVALLKQIS